MKNHSPEHISGWKTANDWRVVKDRLLVTREAGEWRHAFDDFFKTRLSQRYLGPIKLLQEHGTFQGEGFSIAAIQCSLIEFLESTLQGMTYRYPGKGETLKPFEYSSSSDIFRSFLTKRAPFATEFTDNVARDFYSGVRCGLLHEARTKLGWRIHAVSSAGAIIDSTDKILFRDNFQTALLQFVDDYGEALQHNHDYQDAFIRKFDSLC